jgi:CysZ protein
MPRATPLRFSDGLRALPRAVGLLASDPKLLVWLLIPLGLTLLIDAFLLYGAHAWLSASFSSWLPSGTLFAALRWILTLAADFFVYFALKWAFLFVFLTLTGPFQDLISEAIEAKLQGHPVEDPAGFANLFWGIGQSLWQAVVLTGLELLFLLLGVIPLVGPVLFFVFSVLVFGYVFMTIPGGRKLHTLSSRWALCRKNLGATFALGLVAFVSEFLPWLSVAMLPVLVVAGTILYWESEGKGQRSA